ncbi:hypothetical protein QZH41_004948 [Actinostola sp. cb2023]|nr:hypothetical protein QZH41_004948 [Actinostola sp. cb2023]
MLGLICVTIVMALCNDVTQAATMYNGGDGNVHKLSVVQDVTLESPNSNYNWLQYLIVGKHPQFPKKRSLIQFESITSNQCPLHKVRWAKMYIYFQYAHKASWHSVSQTPYISRPIQVHRVKKSWKESEATSSRRMNGQNWTQAYLDLNNNDAEATPQAFQTTIYTIRPKGFVEFDVTRAVKSWVSGQPNHGLLFWATDENVEGRDVRFASNAEQDLAKRPFLHVMCDY